MANISELHLPDGTTKIIEDGTLWSGHRAAWEALTTEEQSKYRYVMFDDDSETGETVDAVTDGDMRAVTSNAVFDALGFGRRITPSYIAVSGDDTTICSMSEFTGNYIGIQFAFSSARTMIDFPKIMLSTNVSISSRFYIYINEQCNGILWLRVNGNNELTARFSNAGSATSGFSVHAYTHN